MAVTALLRAKFIEAGEYQAKWDTWEEGGREGPAPPRDLAMEAVVRVLNGEDRIRAHVHRAHDILAIIRLSQEFGFGLTIHHSTEAYKVADEIAEAGIDVVGMPLFTRIALSDEVMATGRLMNEKGRPLHLPHGRPGGGLEVAAGQCRARECATGCPSRTRSRP